MNEFVRFDAVDADDPGVVMPVLLALDDIMNIVGVPNEPDSCLIMTMSNEEVVVKHTFEDIYNMLSAVGYVLTP